MSAQWIVYFRRVGGIILEAGAVIGLTGIRAMNTARAYEEVIEFIAAGTSPSQVASYQPSAEARAQVADLVNREKAGELSSEEKSELDHYLQLEHIMRLAKARARLRIGHE